MNKENVELLNQLNQQHEMLTGQINTVEQQIKEITVFDEELDTLHNNQNAEILAPIGKSVFALMKLNNNQKFFVDVGAGYFVRKNVDETKKVANEQRVRLEMFREQLSNELNHLTDSLNELIVQHSGTLN